MRELDRLSSEELALVCRRTGEECGSRFSQIAKASDPSDYALRDLLEKMALETCQQARSIEIRDESRPADGSERLTSDRVGAIVRSAISFLSKGFGEGRLSRDIALYHAESLAEELARFYRKLAECANETRVRTVCCRLSDREQKKFHFLREVVF
jgi:hypothetical protein